MKTNKNYIDFGTLTEKEKSKYRNLAKKLGLSVSELELIINHGLFSYKDSVPSDYEIMNFIKKVENCELFPQNVIPYFSSIEAENYYYTNISCRKNSIKRIEIYKSAELAIENGSFSIIKEPHTKYKLHIVPSTINYYFDDGTEIGMSGITCGYEGTGPSTACEILKDIGVDYDRSTIFNEKKLIFNL